MKIVITASFAPGEDHRDFTFIAPNGGIAILCPASGVVSMDVGETVAGFQLQTIMAEKPQEQTLTAYDGVAQNADTGNGAGGDTAPGASGNDTVTSAGG
jgi:hypothetical protein